ncbi:unnamed protein product [Ceutorhynchus assimilis]|uniref:C2H2-type domain-containing protein n=1 Tax=Ceutorhynchus assimilis TaxID=467358 RepID=A0A9P0GRT8_9CUCU|nr:unnamed protein product [Ceutorhynchus assimilis]
MNFSPFGSPLIHQFAAKLTQDVSPSNSFPNSPAEDTFTLTNRYTANGIPSFTQHHHATTAQHQQLFAASSKSNGGNYLGSPIYSPMSKRQNFEQPQNFDSIFAMRSPSNGENNNKKKDHHYQDKPPIQNLQLPQNHQTQTVLNPWQNLATSTNAVADYLSQLPASTLPLSLHEFLKYSAETLNKKDNTIEINGSINTNNNTNSGTLSTIDTAHLHNNIVTKKKKKKKQEKEKKPKPRPGEIRLSTALDGSTLYCCPECHMALPERDLLEQHLMGHNMERRFVCDICGAALKRKDHLTRHKQSHNPERPFVCSVCLKAFKRKEQLTLHFVIHSGEKRHVCTECGKGFYRKDHLRKHTRSHIARRVKAELSQQGAGLHGISS